MGRNGSIIRLTRIVATLLLAHIPICASAGQNIAILDFKPNNVPAGDAAVVTDFVRAAYVKSGAYTVVDKANMDKLLAEQAFQQTGCTDSECAVKLGKLLNVQKMVLGNYAVAGSVRFLTATLVDVETGKIERTGKVKGFEPGEIDAAAEELTRQMTNEATPSAINNMERKNDTTEISKANEQKMADERIKAAKRQEDKEAQEKRTNERYSARIARGRYGLGLNWPGLGLRMLLGKKIMLEARGQYDNEARAYGGRAYMYVLPEKRMYPYIGIGATYIAYTSKETQDYNIATGTSEEIYYEATGSAGEAYMGLEYFAWRNLSIQADIGAGYLLMKGKGTSAEALRYIVNFGITLYH